MILAGEAPVVHHSTLPRKFSSPISPESFPAKEWITTARALFSGSCTFQAKLLYGTTGWNTTVTSGWRFDQWQLFPKILTATEHNFQVVVHCRQSCSMEQQAGEPQWPRDRGLISDMFSLKYWYQSLRDPTDRIDSAWSDHRRNEVPNFSKLEYVKFEICYTRFKGSRPVRGQGWGSQTLESRMADLKFDLLLGRYWP